MYRLTHNLMMLFFYTVNPRANIPGDMLLHVGTTDGVGPLRIILH
jgi:hypothetical protein